MYTDSYVSVLLDCQLAKAEAWHLALNCFAIVVIFHCEIYYDYLIV